MCPHLRNGTMPGTPESENVARDLTAALAELEQIRWTLTHTQRLARLGSWERDLVTGESRWSDEMYRIHGLTPGEVTPTKEIADGFTHPEDVGIREEWLEELVNSPRTEIERSWRIVLDSGETRTVRARGTLVREEDGSTRRLIGTVQDTTEEARGKQAEAVLAQIVQSATEAIVTIGLDKSILSWNPAAEKLYGYTAEEAIGQGIDMLLPEDVSPAARQLRSARLQRLRNGTIESEEYQETRRRKDGTLIEIHARSAPLRDHNGTIIGLVTNIRDITERRRAEERLAHLASHDALTGLFNRHRFEEELAAASARAEHEGHEAAVLALDVDNFKDINETYGHNTGDELVAELADVLRSTVRSTDVLARLDGDSFGVLTTPSSVHQATKLAERLLDAVRKHEMEVGDHTISVSASVGVASFGGTVGSISATTAELMADVDRAMYESKESGRDRVTVYSATDRINGLQRRRSTSEHLIRDALRNDSFELHAQPIVRLSTGVMSHVEVLLRLRRDGQLLSPGAFLPAAERQGLIHLIDYWVISHAFEVAAQHPDLTFDINLSGATIDDGRVESFVAQELRNSGVDPRRIVFELTETAAVGNISRARELAQRLNDLGCRFAIDDFGAGFSTFYYLKHFPADYLKIDGEFMNDPRSRMDELVIQSIVRLAVDLGKETIAEYVADEHTLERVRTLGVDFGQGYHFAKPFPVTDLAGIPRRLDPTSAQMPAAFRDVPSFDIGAAS